MLKSMTGFSKIEAKEKGFTASVEIKTLNGKYLDINCRLPKSLSAKEFEIRDMVKGAVARGTISIFVNVEKDFTAMPVAINHAAAEECFRSLNELKKRLKVKEPVTFDNLMQFSDSFFVADRDDNSELEWKLVRNALKQGLIAMDKMRIKEGQEIFKDVQTRIKGMSTVLEKVESMGLKRIPEERERLRLRVAQLFESDEIDEHRIQTELVLLADKLDISEECVRLRSHIKFFNETVKAKEPIGRKVNFLLQEMNREINTIGSKCNDAVISQSVVNLKEELERIREQVMNIE